MDLESQLTMDVSWERERFKKECRRDFSTGKAWKVSFSLPAPSACSQMISSTTPMSYIEGEGEEV
jgi:hypothetical protein